MSNLIDRLAGNVEEPMRPGETAEKDGVVNIDRVPLGRPGLLAIRTKQLQGLSEPQPISRSTFLATPVGDDEWGDSSVIDRFDY
jgi:hypothetical protein